MEASNIQNEAARPYAQLIADADWRKIHAQNALSEGKEMKLNFYETCDDFLNNTITVEVWFE